jgi:Flp pilus assembly pilin Flp
MRRPLPDLLADDSGQAATEYILIIGLISIPIYVFFKIAFEKFLSDFVASLVESFTRG